MTHNRMTEQEIATLGREALEDSVENMDAHTLSQLNRVRQKAMTARQYPSLLGALLPAGTGLWNGWLPVGAAGCAALALAVALPVSTPVTQTAEDMALPFLAEDTSMAALEDVELLEDLEMMMWLVDVENHAS